MISSNYPVQFYCNCQISSWSSIIIIKENTVSLLTFQRKGPQGPKIEERARPLQLTGALYMSYQIIHNWHGRLPYKENCEQIIKFVFHSWHLTSWCCVSHVSYKKVPQIVNLLYINWRHLWLSTKNQTSSQIFLF